MTNTLTLAKEAAVNDPTRESVDAAIAAGAWLDARLQLERIFRQSPTLANAQLVLTRIGKIETGGRRTVCRMAILRSFTVEPVALLLRAAAVLRDIDLEVRVGEFNAYPQEIIDPSSWLYEFEPNVVVIAAQTRDLAPDLWLEFTELTAEQASEQADQVVRHLTTLMTTLRSRSGAHLIVHDFETPETPNAGVLDAQLSCSQIETIQKMNAGLRRFAAGQTGMHVLDYDGLVARHGRGRWHDERKWLTARLPIAADCLIHLAHEYEKFLLPITGRVCKALAVDLDNTLWGGVIGEDGMTGIKVGAEYPGAAFLALQRAILDLYRRGVILAVCSKNNPADAMEALESHPEMLLRPHHFAALRINWTDKAQNLREIAAELNIGIDAVAFIDDNPVERQRVRTEVPEVTVIDLPADPMDYASALRACPVFERLTLSTEDQERGRYYAEQRQRTELQETAGSLEDFYRSLQMKAEIEPVADQTLARIAQLTQKTNQFNLTTRRYTEQEIAALRSDATARVYGIRVVDKFGDNGLVGVALLRLAGETAEIDTFLMSCRVIGRTVETAMLAHLMDEARAAGAQRMTGWFLPTKKNTPSKDFYAFHGFTVIEETGDGQLWAADLAANATTRPEWIA